MPSLLGIAALAALALVAGGLGCFVVWRRMAYFGDALSHTSLLGVALGAMVGLSASAMSFLLCAGFALALLFLMRQDSLSTDTLLGILAHGALAVGLLALALAGKPLEHVHGELLGSIGGLSSAKLWPLLLVCTAVALLLWRLWPSLLLWAVDEDLARSGGVPRFAMQAALLLMVTATIAVAMPLIGVLLMTALLILPAAAARLCARTPEQMAALAALIAAFSLALGVALAESFAMPAGPLIVCVALAVFISLSVLRAVLRSS